LIQTRREDFAQSVYAANVTLSNGPVGTMLHNAADKAQAMAQLASMVEQNATVVSYDYVFRICAIVFFISIPTVMILANPKKAGAAPAEAHAVIE
jgi:hypothetical protein